MNLFELNDDPGGFLTFGEKTWMLVWAWGADEARRLFVENYEHLYDAMYPDADQRWLIDDENVRRIAAVTRIVRLPEVLPELPVPHVERRPEVQRRRGWRTWFDAAACEECGLYGMDVVEVCGACGVCDVCGCVCREFA